MSRPRSIAYQNAGYSPYEQRPEEAAWQRCTVCGWWLDGSRTGEPSRFAGITLQTTGTTWYSDISTFPDIADNLSDKDLVVEATVAAYAACPLCGSGNWRNGNGLEGLAPRR
jgi:hypothetical protein